MELGRINEYTAQVERSERKTFEPYSGKLKVGFDLDTAYIVPVILGAEDRPTAYEKRAASALCDGAVVDYVGTCRIVRELKEKLEIRLGQPLERCAIAVPAGTDSSLEAHTYMMESTGAQVINVLDEPAAANTTCHVSDGVMVDTGGGTTGPAALKDGKVVQIKDESTGDIHLTLVLVGSYQIPVAEAGAIKLDSSRRAEISPVVKTMIEKMAVIVKRYVSKEVVSATYLCGRICCLAEVEPIFGKETRTPAYGPENPSLVTPMRITMNYIEK